MPNTTENNLMTERLNALDPGLPFLASQAAIELDNLLLGREEVVLKSVKQLAARLECSTEQIGTVSRKSLMDPTTIAVFNSAVMASGMSVVHTLAELAEGAWRIANGLQSSKPGSDRIETERLRAFCNQLARSAIAHERSLYDMQSVHADWS